MKAQEGLPEKLDYVTRQRRLVPGVDTVEVLDSNPNVQNWVAQVADKALAREIVKRWNNWTALEGALNRAQQDINWMLNNRQFLNGDCFDYVEAALKEVEAE